LRQSYILIPLLERKALVRLRLPINQAHTRNALKYLIVKHAAVPKRHKTEFVTGVMLARAKNRAKFGVIRVIVVATKEIVVLV
jgi:hypothetical protein